MPGTDAGPSRVAEIAQAVSRWQDATARFDEAVGRRLNLNGAERRCLARLAEGPQTPSALASGVGLTRSAMTALLDRLVARELIARHPDPHDRRQVRVEATARAQAEAMELYRPLAEEGMALLARRSPEDLQAILDFVTEALDLQLQTLAALEQGPK